MQSVLFNLIWKICSCSIKLVPQLFVLRYFLPLFSWCFFCPRVYIDLFLLFHKISSTNFDSWLFFLVPGDVVFFVP
jgi:hypothetical protein